MFFVFQSVIMVYCTNWFSYVEPTVAEQSTYMECALLLRPVMETEPGACSWTGGERESGLQLSPVVQASDRG